MFVEQEAGGGAALECDVVERLWRIRIVPDNAIPAQDVVITWGDGEAEQHARNTYHALLGCFAVTLEPVKYANR